MISQKDLNVYQYRALEEYFIYIFESVEVGNRNQAKELFNDLSQEQRGLFWAWALDLEHENLKKCVRWLLC